MLRQVKPKPQCKLKATSAHKVGGGIVIKLVGICGSRVKRGNMEALLDEAMTHARQHPDVEAEAIPLWDKETNGCNQCNWCIKNQSEDKPCVQDDDMKWIYPKLL